MTSFSEHLIKVSGKQEAADLCWSNSIKANMFLKKIIMVSGSIPNTYILLRALNHLFSTQASTWNEGPVLRNKVFLFHGLMCLQIEDIIATVRDSNLKLTLAFGIGMHHAGLHERDRKTVEELFVNCKIQVGAAAAHSPTHPYSSVYKQKHHSYSLLIC